MRMMKNSQVRFRPGSRLPANLGVSPEITGTVLCNYLISNPVLGAPERIDVRFECGRVAWGVPIAEFVPVGKTGSEIGKLTQAA
jgi:hypothetical protein